MEKYGFVYIWRDRKHKRFYIGCHWGTENDGYICSSNWMRDAYKRRPEDFKRRILVRVYSEREDMFLYEKKFLSMINDEELGKKYYNLQKYLSHWSIDSNKTASLKERLSYSLRGDKHPNFGKKLSEETKEKIRKKHLGKLMSNESRKKMSEAKKGKIPWNKGKSMSEESRKKMSEAKKGLFLSDTIKNNLKGRIPWNKGKSMSEDTKIKLSKSLKGKKHTEETKLRISKTMKKIKQKDGGCEI